MLREPLSRGKATRLRILSHLTLTSPPWQKLEELLRSGMGPFLIDGSCRAQEAWTLIQFNEND